MNITVDYLKSINACSKAIIKFKKHGDCELIELLTEVIQKKQYLDWANWLIVRCMNKKNYISYVIFAAEQVISFYEKKYPKDKNLREAIEAAKKYINNPNIKNKKQAYTAATAAYTAADATYTVAATYAAYAVAYAAYTVAYAAYAVVADVDDTDAAYAAAETAYAAAETAAADKTKIQIKILKYGIKLLENEKTVQ